MRQSFEILDIFGFWREFSNITRTCLEYMVTYMRLECFPAKKIGPHRSQLQFIIPYENDILETREWEANEDQR